ncbi:PREDICTED: zinc finger CCHC domain-containing protein 24-like [Amphimedon queenslandica]|uniref:3CxxC-type domain-containing protein n=2 Tax=Amphimedon queenslandica TaxID=400682 RepID=A0AAN0JBC8_AMPQE|nr:PREDICTED: zinc finger CCHC domain-containing protein 24-like [Amphimedon queenslandica]|eukprot:XP_019854056.1 PREDICTED: zinc finger CCHC domain-containing protein 24-like [Amphimedon queenslandica]
MANRRQILRYNLTPYQGNKRVFGEFDCHNCDNAWSSAFSYADTWQMCEVCNMEIYPHRQYPLLRGKNNSKKPHQSHLCGKCQELGHNCSKYK